MAIVGLIQEDDETSYREWVDQFVGWCRSTFLHLNIKISGMVTTTTNK